MRQSRLSNRSRVLIGLAAAAGLAAAVVGTRRLLTPSPIADPDGDLVVTTTDGVQLNVELDSPDAAGPTVVLVHGFTARLEEWMLQRETLHGRRVLAYDHRGHGRSGWGEPARATLDQLAEDLRTVIDAHAPGKVVLVGHSMGGMTLMAFARRYPELIGTRVVGAFLLATSAGAVAQDGVAGGIIKVGTRLGLLTSGLRLLQVTAPGLQRLRKPGSKAGYAFTRQYLFGTDDADPETVRLVQQLLEMAPFSVSAAFYPLFVDLDELASLRLLRSIPVSVLVGDADRLTPVDHSRTMMPQLGQDAELTVVPGAGHSVNITRQQVVDDAILRLLKRVDAFLAGFEAAIS